MGGAETPSVVTMTSTSIVVYGGGCRVRVGGVDGRLNLFVDVPHRAIHRAAGRQT